jgi:metal-responsive CopG/Arc/MetJ family transcriptional regulator
MYNRAVRITIDLDREHRVKLLELAERRGEKDLSAVIAEAIQAYLESASAKERLRKRALALRGTLPKAEAESLKRHPVFMRSCASGGRDETSLTAK